MHYKRFFLTNSQWNIGILNHIWSKTKWEKYSSSSLFSSIVLKMATAGLGKSKSRIFRRSNRSAMSLIIYTLGRVTEGSVDLSQFQKKIKLNKTLKYNLTNLNHKYHEKRFRKECRISALIQITPNIKTHFKKLKILFHTKFTFHPGRNYINLKHFNA